MRLAVMDAAGILVADVTANEDCPFVENPGESPGFVIGRFSPGPGFPAIAEKLEHFHAVYEQASFAEAVAVHEEFDRLGLVAIDPTGTTYVVTHVHFDQGGLLFCATWDGAA